jgi:monoamine oxidase
VGTAIKDKGVHTMLDAIVIGAGMAGITAARDLAASGLSVCVVEARDRIGGRVYSVRDFCDEPVEGGAEFIHGVGAATGIPWG